MAESEDDDEISHLRFTRRAALLGLGQLGIFGLIGARLYRLQVVDGPLYAPLADDNRISIVPLAPVRGRILDRRGAVLASNRESNRIVVIPAQAGDLAATIDVIATIVDIPIDERRRLVERAKRWPSNQTMPIASGLSFEQVARVNMLAPDTPGVRTDVEYRRQYFRGADVGHVVGFVGAVERPALDDDPVLRLPDMRIGKMGVERGMEGVLRGTPGRVKHEVDARGRIIRTLERHDPVAGSDVVLTLDADVQAKVLARLSGLERAAAVALDIETGGVLAMASVPRFDNAQLAGAEAGRAIRRLRTIAHNPMVNRTIRGAYPPGSTFKMVTMLAALKAGVIGVHDRIACNGRYEYADHTFRCWNRGGHGTSDLHKAIRESCDVYFYELARRTGIVAIASMARALGFGQTFNCGIALQRAGVVPDPDWKRIHAGQPWLGGETVLAGIGQGYVLATPLQLAVMTARLAGGRAVLPTLIHQPALPAPAAHKLDVRPEWLAAIRNAMNAVVNEPGGTGGAARLPAAGPRLSGKSGTSQVGKSTQNDHALFVGFAPSDRPRYAVAAVVEHGGSGGQVAGPIVRDIVAELLNRPANAELQAVNAVRRTGG